MRPPPLDPLTGTAAPGNTLEVVGLSKVFPSGQTEVRALTAVTFSARRGEFLAIMGASGSGKSTLLHLIGGLDAPSEGEVRLDGVSLHTQRDSELTRIRRHQIGFIFQFFNLIPTLTARENVALPLLIAREPAADRGKRVDDLLAFVGLSDRAHHRPDQLSGGEQQRVAIARALVLNPPLILADEPTGNLDSRNAERVYELLATLSRERPRTVVMVTHDAAGAAHADRVIFLKDGAIVGEMKARKRSDAASVASAYEKLAHPQDA